jgi:uncharacterized protein involved in exopolysaccharide biosynthesis
MYQSPHPDLRYAVNRHLATFSRHRIGLILPVVIALLISSWYATSRPHKYESSMTVWLDTAVPGQSSLVNPQYYTPASEAQQTLQELLGTEQFLVDVGHRGPLASYFANRVPVSWINGEIVSALSNKVTASVSGPQVLRITMTSTNPAYMQGTLNAVAAEYLNQVTGTLKGRGQAGVAYYQTQVDSSKLSLEEANAAVTSYQEAHPTASPTSSVTLNQLTQVAFEAQNAYTSNQNSLDQAELSVQNVATPTAFHVIDAASAPFRLSSKKHMIFTIVAGLAAGITISILALSALTARDKTARVPEDIETMLGMNVVGTIEESRRRRLALPRGSRSR